MTFDPYHQWLGIRDPARPPNHYRLLGIELFEADPDVIITAADRQMAHLRTFQHGQDSDVSQQLLNEVAAAKVCLLHAEKKAAYDERLRTAYSPQAPPAPAKKERTPAPELPQVTPSSSLELRPPGRSARQRRRRRLIAAVVLIPLIAAAAGYGLIQWQHRWTDPAEQTVDAEAAGEPPRSDTEPSDLQPPDQKLPNAPSGDAIGNPAAVPNLGSTPPSEPPVTSVEPPAAAVWDTPDRTSRKPPQFAESDPLRSFLLLVSRRDLPAAEAVLEEFQKAEARPNQPLRILEIDRMTVAQAENVLFLIQRFWQAVDEAHSRLVAGVTLNYREQPVTVSAVMPTSVVLQAASGEERPFDLRRSEIPIDVAIALVEWRFADALPTAWRMIGCVLTLDQEGDETRAQEYFQQAELHGFSTQQLVGFFERRDVMTSEATELDAPVREPTPSDILSIPDTASRSTIRSADSTAALDESVERSDATSPADSARPVDPTSTAATKPSDDIASTDDSSPAAAPGSPSERPRWSIPDPAAQTGVLRDVQLELRSELNQSLTKQEYARRFLEKSVSAQHDPIRYYVLLRAAINHGMESGDVATALGALDPLLNSYEINDGQALRRLVVQGLERALEKANGNQTLDAKSAMDLARAWQELEVPLSLAKETERYALERAKKWYQSALASADRTQALEIRRQIQQIAAQLDTIEHGARTPRKTP